MGKYLILLAEFVAFKSEVSKELAELKKEYEEMKVEMSLLKEKVRGLQRLFIDHAASFPSRN